MGGDYAPESTIIGAIQAQKELAPDTKLVLIGNQDMILGTLKSEKINPSLFDIVHTTEVIEMADHPAKAFSKKRDSSIAVGFQMLKDKEIGGLASAGNTHIPPVHEFHRVAGVFSITGIDCGLRRPVLTSSFSRATIGHCQGWKKKD